MKWILALLVSFSAQAHIHHTGELLFRFKNQVKSQVLTAKNGRSLEQQRQRMLASGDYQFVTYNTIETTPNDRTSESELANQWHHTNIRTEAAWDNANDRNSVIVAVCDSGAQADHEDLTGNLLPGWNMVDGVADNSTTTSHGTFVAGLIAAKLNSLGGVGLAPFVKILPLRISNATGSTSMKLITDCIQLAADRGAKVINVSFTGVDSPAVEAAGNYAASKGALLVYAAGNRGLYRSLESYPDYKNVFAVGASNRDDNRWKYWRAEDDWGGSNYGPFIDIMAPGHELYSTTIYSELLPDLRYRVGSGTSYATPVVSGVAALVFSVNPNFTPAQVRSILTRSADSMGSTSNYGAGRVNAARALELAVQSL
jgi:subtilisin family serine protease